MATTFNVFSLGVQASIDPTEGNNIAENASALVGQTFGSASAPLHQNIQELSTGSTGFGGGNSAAYDQNGNVSTDTFRIDGGGDQTFDATAGYNVTINYSDGTSATITGVIFQDTAGNTYLAPEFSSNTDQTALEAKAIESITLDSLFSGDFSGMTGDRVAGTYVTPDGTIDGTAGDDVIGADYGDVDGDVIDGFDGDSDLVYGAGGNDGIEGRAGSDTLYGGTGNDVIVGYDANAISTGDISVLSDDGSADTLFGGDGNDTLAGGGGADILDGGDNDDLLYGGDGDDTLDGFRGANQLYGGAGSDELTGGFETATIYGGDDQDTIRIGFGDDTIFGGEGGTDRDTIDGSLANDQLTINFTGNEAGTFADNDGDSGTFEGIESFVLSGRDDVLTASAASSAVTVFAGDGADSITGGSGADSVSGGAGNDTISAGAGHDTIEGGTGNDSIFGDTNNDRLYGGDGNDTLDGGVGSDHLYGGDGDDLVQGGGNTGNADHVYGGDGNDSVLGGNGASQDTVYGDAGNDTLDGQRGADTIFGGDGADTFLLSDNFGADTIYGGEGGTDSDTLDLSALGSGVTVTYTGDEEGTFTDGADTATFFEIEDVILTDQNDVLDASNDTVGVSIDASAGDDSVDGGAGDDVIYGGSGDDSITGGDGSDTLFGGTGGDTIAGGAGADSIDGDSGMDFVDYSASGSGVDVNLTTGSGSGGDAQGDSYHGVDGIIGSSLGDTLTGSDAEDLTPGEFFFTNVFYGGGGDDSLSGLGGSDTLYGGADNDSIDGGAGDDLIEGGDGDDTIDGGAGDDRISTGEGRDSVDAGAGNDSITGGNSAGGSETLSGGTGNDTIDGGGGFDIVYGGDGADIITDSGGNGSQDTIYGGDGHDSIAAGNAADTVFGGAGDDVVDGGAGDDTLTGGAGNDTLTGGTGEDVFVLDAGGGNDVITDFDSSDDGSTVIAAGQTRSGMVDQLDISALSDVGNALTNQDGTVTANEITVSGGGGADQLLTFPGGESVTVPDGTVDTSTPAAQFASLVAMGVPPCFAPGTLIETPDGPCSVEDLRVGDMVTTADRGPQPLRWIGVRQVDFGPSNPRGDKDKPVEIKPGALGPGVPRRTLVVSPQHRMVLAGPEIAETFKVPEVFAIAKALISLKGVRRMLGRRQISYYALLFDRHEVIFAEGTRSESFRPGPVALDGFSQQHRAEIYRLYPGMIDDPERALGPPARKIISKREAQSVIRNGPVANFSAYSEEVPDFRAVSLRDAQSMMATR